MKKINQLKLIFFICLIIFLITIYSSNYILFQLPKDISNKIAEKTNINLWPRYYTKLDTILRFIDDINIFYFKKDLLDGTFPVYELKLSKEDIKHFDEVSKASIDQGYLVSDINTWRNAEIKIKGNTYKIKTKLRGDTANHWDSRLKSYKVKTESAEYIGNMREFNLIIFEDRLLWAKIGRLLAKNFNLFDIRDDIIVLKINGIVHGLYYLQEPQDSLFLENNKCSNCVIISESNNYIEDHPNTNKGLESNGIYWGVAHYTAFSNELTNINPLDTELFNEDIHSSIDNLYNSIRNNEFLSVEDFYDMDQLSSYESWRMILGTFALATGENFRMAYSQTDGKFYPIPRSEFLNELRLHKGGLEWWNSLQTGLNPIYDNYIVENIKYWNNNDELRQMKYKKLYNFVTTKSADFLEEVMKLNNILPYLKSYKTNTFNKRYFDWVFESYNQMLKHNFNMIQQNLEYAKAYVNIKYKENKIIIDIMPDSTSAIQIDKLRLTLNGEYRGKVKLKAPNYYNKIEQDFDINSENIDLTEFISNIPFSPGLDQEMNPSVKHNLISIEFAESINLENVDIGFTNYITQKKIHESDIYLKISNQNNFYPVPKNVEEFKTMNPELNLKSTNNELTIIPGKYVVTKNIIIPKNTKLIIPKGTYFQISPEVSIMSYGQIDILGTESEPVIITSLNPNQPFGAFGIIGNNKEKSLINYLDLSGGSEAWVNGIFFSGALSIYRTNVEITNSKIHDNYADDGLNIKYGDILIDNSSFYDNFADQVDLDFVTGVVKKSIFKESNSDANGDGLDFSGSKIIVKSNRFNNFQDKGISIGEKTNIILYDNLIAENNNGAAVKDLSNAYFISNIFLNNVIAINSYQKKPLFGGGYTYIYNNNFENNGDIYVHDEKSNKSELNLDIDKLNKLKELIAIGDIEQSFKVLQINI